VCVLDPTRHWHHSGDESTLLADCVEKVGHALRIGKVRIFIFGDGVRNSVYVAACKKGAFTV
jgi:hypothetical protein